MTKEQEELQEKHERFKELQEKRHAGSISEQEERELVQIASDIQERSINISVSKALEERRDEEAEKRDAEEKFYNDLVKAYRTRSAVEVSLRATTMTTNVSAASPKIINDILEPLEAELIYSKVGLRMQRNVVGQPVWPSLTGVTATIAGEDVELSDQSVNIDSLSAKSERIGATVPVTIQAISSLNLGLLDEVKKLLGTALGQVLNKAMFAKTAPSAPNNGIGTVLAEAYANPVASKWSATVDPTLREVVSLEAAILDKDVRGNDRFAYFVHPTVGCTLKTTPEAPNSPNFIYRNGQINGYKVVESTVIPNDAILFGSPQYAVMANHGSGDRLYAEYNPKKDRIEVTINGDYSLTVLRKEAFACLKRK